jgi:hypothetical protein
MKQQEEITLDRKLINELAKTIKSEKDISALSKQLLKLTVERPVSRYSHEKFWPSCPQN